MTRWPRYPEETRQNKAGKTDAGSQRYRCMHCQRKYTPEPKAQGYPESLRKRAAEMYVDGMNLRKIARQLKIHHRTVALWVVECAEALPHTPMPEDVKEAELDELFTFLGDKKTKSTFCPWSTAKPVVCWAGQSSGNARRKRYNKWWMRPLKPNGITAMALRRMLVCGITSAGTP